MKNFGGGGKKLTRKNRKFLMKLYRKNRTRKYRGGGKIDDSDGLIRLYKTTEDLHNAGKGAVQRYLINVIYKNPSTDEEMVQRRWLTKDEYNNFNIDIKSRKRKEEEEEGMREGKTMMNTIASDEVNKDWELYEAAAVLVQDETKPPTMFTGNFHHIRPVGRVTFTEKTEHSDGKVSPTKQGGGGKELPTFESTKTKLKEILEKVKPDNEYYEFSQKLNQELNKIEEKKFNEFVNKIYENFDKIMSIPIKQEGGMLSVRRSTRDDDEVCSICFEPLIPRFGPEASEIHKVVECSQRRGQHKFHEHCILSSRRNVCPLCRHEDTFLNNRGESIMRNNVPVQINNMVLRLNEMAPEDQAVIMNIRDQRRRAIVRHDRLVSVRHRILELWGMFLLLFTARSTGVLYRGQYDYNYATFLAMFYGSVILVGFWPERRGSVSMTDQLTEFIVRILTFLDDAAAYLDGGKKTRRKRYKRKRRTKRKMRKKRGGVKTGDMVKKKYKMDKLDENGNPTGEKFWQDFKGSVQNIDKKGNTTIYWYADKSTDVLTKSQSKSLEVIQPKPVAIGDMHQAHIPPRTGVSYTVEEHRFKPLSQKHLTPAVKPKGFVPGISKPRDDGFAEMMKNPEDQLKKLKSME
jgi:hypothetical protein